MPSIEPKIKQVHVAVGVVLNSSGEVLIAQRAEHQHQGGLWEFPGGKVESGESVMDALARELREELGIHVHSSRPLISIPHEYKDKSVLLDVHVVDSFSGVPAGLEGQPVLWVGKNCLSSYEFPEANKPIVSAICLPGFVAISSEFDDLNDFKFRVARAVARGAGMIYLRENFSRLPNGLLEAARAQCAELAVPLMVKPDVWLRAKSRQDLGVHFSSAELKQLRSLPEVENSFIGGSCHSLAELELASRLGLDYVFLSPLNKTSSHPGAALLSHQQFFSWVVQSKVPVYALGGLAVEDSERVQQMGAQGVAGISAFWR